MDQSTTRYRGYIILCSVLSLIAGGVVGYFTPRPQATSPVTLITAEPAAHPSPTATPLPVRVYVCGAVINAGVYRLPGGSIVQDALEAASGPTDDADLVRINLAQELRDQQQVYVPREGETDAPPSVSSGASGGPSGVLININTATIAELERLPGIGPTMAQRIADYREAHGPFQSIEEIMEVPGIGPTTFEEMRDLITVQ